MVMNRETNKAYTFKIKFKCISKEAIYLCMSNTQKQEITSPKVSKTYTFKIIFPASNNTIR
jgi:hypothetical protein